MVDVRAAGVARRAAELALAAGVDLPDGLALWRLAGERPLVTPVPGRPEELGDLLEAAFPPATRRAQGAHYTPATLSAELADRAVATHDRPTVGDPACGGGALLLAAARHLAARGQHPTDVVARLWGMDVDPLAVATTEVALTLWAGTAPPPGRLVVGDALRQPPSWPPLDVVVANPPFLSPLGAVTARSAADSAALRARFGPAVRAYTDTAGLFLLAACDLAAPGGTVAVVQPLSVLGARDAAGVRDAVTDRARLTDVWVPANPGFAAAVEVCIPVLEVGAAGPATAWSTHLARAHGVPPVDLAGGGRTLAEEASTTAGFRSEYYGLVEHVHEQSDCPTGVPIVTTGLVDLGAAAWGARPARLGKRSWDRPVVDVPALSGRAADWVRRTRGPKLVVATQTQVIEVAVDLDGAWIPGVPLIAVLAPPDRLWPLAAALASPAITAWALERTAGTARAGRALKVTAALLREVPLPNDAGAWRQGTDALRAGDLEAFAAAMSAAYGTDGHLEAWWSDRARTVWSPSTTPR